MNNYIDSFINGHIIAGDNIETSNVCNPSTGAITGLTRFATESEVDHCIDVAKAAFIGWSNTPPIRRARILLRYNQLLNQYREQLAEMISFENGKTYQDALGEVVRGIEVVEFAAGIPHLLKGDFSENVGREVDTVSMRQPLGVVAGITPFNFPAMVPMWMFPVALACGNTFILKPSEKVPSTSLLLAKLLKEAGCPDGVFNVLQGGRAVVEKLISSSEVSALSFVGSTPVAKSIYSQGANYGKRVQALGGAKNHMVVMPDADIDASVSALMGAAYGSAGQRCMAISVAVAVGDDVADALVAKLESGLDKLKIGVANDKDAEMGPLVSAAHRDNIVSLVDSGVADGATLVVDGRDYVGVGEAADGFFLGGCLFDHVTPDMNIYKKEIFGPVLCVVRVQSYEDALQLVNAHEFGNGVSIFTQAGNIARHFASNVITGMVGVNVPIPVPVAYHSFGGWKASLFGSQHVYGPEGINFYTRVKAVTSRWQAPSESQYVMPTLD